MGQWHHPAGLCFAGLSSSGKNYTIVQIHCYQNYHLQCQLSPSPLSQASTSLHPLALTTVPAYTSLGELEPVFGGQHPLLPFHPSEGALTPLQSAGSHPFSLGLLYRVFRLSDILVTPGLLNLLYQYFNKLQFPHYKKKQRQNKTENKSLTFGTHITLQQPFTVLPFSAKRL